MGHANVQTKTSPSTTQAKDASCSERSAVTQGGWGDLGAAELHGKQELEFVETASASGLQLVLSGP
jgi:hypothetical protein